VITCEHIFSDNPRRSCDNCNREMPLILRYEFSDNTTMGQMAYGELHLCEDCSNALSNLHRKVMEQGKTHKYDMDEISEVIL